jgi:hypothetical protein
MPAMLGSLGLILGDRAMAQTVTAISNLNQPVNNAPPIGGSVWQAVSFTTQSTANYLVSVSVSLIGPINMGIPSAPGPFVLSLYSNAGGVPGTSVATLYGNSYPTNNGVYTYTNSSSVELAAGSNYWLVAASPATDLASPYMWADTYSTNLDAGSLWTLGVTENYDGSNWNLNSGAYLQFSLMVATTNLPAISIYQPLVLTFPSNPQVPLVLQQNSDLASTNWVTATNAVQMATVSANQTVFIVPPSGRQLFFRLNVQ